MENKLIHTRKRNGTLEPFDIQKIKYMLAWATDGLDVNPLVLETSLTVAIVDGVNTRDIHQNTKQIATSLISVEEPDWTFVAGRLHTTGYTKDVTLKRGFGYGSVKRYMEYQVARGVYGKHMTFTDEQYALSDALLDPEYDMLFDTSGAITATDRYCLDNELIQEIFMSISLLVARELENEYSMDFQNTLVDMYQALASLELSASTPLLLNLRRPTPNLSSCYIIQPSDNMSSIFDNIKNLAMISKNAGGVGFNLDKLRAQGSWIKDVFGAASGVVPCVKVLNDTATYVDQEGKRAGAVSPSLSAWHLDLLEFLEIQLEEGDLRTKSFDVLPQIIYNDLFFERANADEEWSMFDPYEVKKVTGYDLSTVYGEEFEKAYTMCESLAEVGELRLTHKVRARDIVKAHYTAMRISGMPYQTFKDNIQKGNPNKHAGTIYAANICVESFSNFEADKLAHTCNLVSVNVARCVKVNKSIEETHARIREVSALATKFLDATISMGTPSIKESVRHNELYRTVGVGVVGGADYMAYYGLSYENEKGIRGAQLLMENISLAAITASMEMAKASAPYEMYQGSEWSKGNLLGQDWEIFKNDLQLPDEWGELRDNVLKYGVRNGQIMAIAPNSSTGIFQGVGQSILPVWKLMYTETLSIGNVIRLPYFVKDRALWYKAYPQVDMEKMVEFIAGIQKFVDSGISFELVLDLNNEAKSNVRYWYALSDKARQLGVKTLYYTRFITQDTLDDVVFDTGCIGCKN